MAARRVTDALLFLLAAAIPLSTTAMEGAVLALGVLTLLTAARRQSPVRATPLDGVLGLFYATLALSTVVSGHLREATGWARLWVVVTYFVVFWWLRDRRQTIRFVYVLDDESGAPGRPPRRTGCSSTPPAPTGTAPPSAGPSSFTPAKRAARAMRSWVSFATT